MQHVSYFDAIDINALRKEFPVGQAFVERFAGMGADTLRQWQETLFARQLQRAWQIPFYQRLWAEAGVAQGDIRSLDDIGKLPSFGKHEIMQSVERNPPLGDHHGRDIPVNGKLLPMVLQSTSGTTGSPQRAASCAVEVCVAAGTPKNGTKTAPRRPKSMSGR